jgi:hypothetical protein
VKEKIYVYCCAGGSSHCLKGYTKNRLLFYVIFLKLKVLVTFGIPRDLLAGRYIMAATSLPTTKKRDHLEKNVK